MLASNGGPKELGEIGGAEVGEPHGREGGLEGGTGAAQEARPSTMWASPSKVRGV